MLRLLLDESQVAGPVLVRDADLALAHENKGKAFRMDFCVAPGKLQKRWQFLLQRVTAAICDVWPSSTRQASAALRIATCLRVQDGPQAYSAWMIHAQFGLGKALLCLTVVEDCPDLSVCRRPDFQPREGLVMEAWHEDGLLCKRPADVMGQPTQVRDRQHRIEFIDSLSERFTET